MIDILDKALTQSGTTGSKINFDSILEKIWRSERQFAKYGAKIKLLIKLKTFLNVLHKAKIVKHIEWFSFKLNNLLLLLYNHEAEVVQAMEIVQEQQENTQIMIAQPENFDLVLDFYSRETEVYVNQLDFDTAELKARDYYNLVSEYQNIWELINTDLTDDDYFKSSISIKSRTLLLRALILNFSEENLPEIQKLLSELQGYATHPSNISRIHCQVISLLLKQNKLLEAVNMANEHLESNNFAVFDSFFFLFSLNQLLFSTDSKDDLIKENHENVFVIYNKYKDAKRYPTNLILRELSLFYFFEGQRKLPKELLKLSDKLSLESNSNISKLLKIMNIVQKDFLNESLNQLADYQEQAFKTNIIIDSKHENPMLVLRRFFSS